MSRPSIGVLLEDEPARLRWVGVSRADDLKLWVGSGNISEPGLRRQNLHIVALDGGPRAADDEVSRMDLQILHPQHHLIFEKKNAMTGTIKAIEKNADRKTATNVQAKYFGSKFRYSTSVKIGPTGIVTNPWHINANPVIASARSFRRARPVILDRPIAHRRTSAIPDNPSKKSETKAHRATMSAAWWKRLSSTTGIVIATNAHQAARTIAPDHLATKPGGARTRTAIRYSTASGDLALVWGRRPARGRGSRRRSGEDGGGTRFRRLACVDDEAGGYSDSPAGGCRHVRLVILMASLPSRLHQHSRRITWTQKLFSVENATSNKE
ncbi:hypothetical protein KC356_g38 [Hortaea werneckii]|nr:hypothetical protein KC356_g38 [Hortaea werneckii]